MPLPSALQAGSTRPNRSQPSLVGGIVLCGGKSHRMGVPKAELPFGPETMLQRVVRVLGEAVQPIVVVSAAGQALPPLPEHVIAARDLREGRGPLEGLRAGLEALQGLAEAAYVTGCDAPLLLPEFVRRMMQLLGEHDAAVPVDGGFHHPLAAIYRVRVLPQVAQLLDANDLRPVLLYERVSTRRVPVEELKTADPELQTLANVNCHQDYVRALARAGFAAPA